MLQEGKEEDRLFTPPPIKRLCTLYVPGKSGVCTSPLFLENMGLVIRPNLHRNGEDGVGVGLSWYIRIDSTESLKC